VNALRWKFFSSIIDVRPEETTEYDTYRPSQGLDSSGESLSVYTHIDQGRCFWFFPKEEAPILYQGRQYTVNVILMFKPDRDVTYLDIIKLTLKPGNWYRVVDIQDMRSHMEIHCTNYLPDNGLVFDRYKSGETDIKFGILPEE